MDALKDGPGNDGLIQRFQLLVWPDTVADWTYMDRAPDTACEEQATRVFRRLVELDSENPIQFRFSPDAQEPSSNGWQSLRQRWDFVVFEGATPGKTQNFLVSLDHVKRAAGWCEYLESTPDWSIRAS